LDRILVPLDGTRLSEHALTYVSTLARSDTEVTLLLVSREPESGRDRHGPLVATANDERQRFQRRAFADLRRVADRLQSSAARLAVRIAEADDNPADKIVRAATDLGAGLIFMACEGYGTTGHADLGRPAARVVRTSPIPVFIARDLALGTRNASAAIRRIVVPLDGSDRAAEALAIAEDLAVRLGVPVLLLSVIDAATLDLSARVHEVARDNARYREISADACLDAQRMLDWAGARLMGHKIGVHSMLLTGPAATAITNATAPGDIVVMTRQGRGGRRSPLGSVAERMIASSLVPVVLVPTSRASEIVVVTLDDVLRGEPIGAT
jgi:nucleotide-binding universal stress UspA family protein